MVNPGENVVGSGIRAGDSTLSSAVESPASIRPARAGPHACYEYVDDGVVLSYLEYRATGDVLVLHHTFTEPEHRGEGIAARLVAAALDDLRGEHLRIVPACWFVAEFVDEHPEYRDLVACALIACRVGARPVSASVLVMRTVQEQPAHERADHRSHEQHEHEGCGAVADDPADADLVAVVDGERDDGEEEETAEHEPRRERGVPVSLVMGGGRVGHGALLGRHDPDMVPAMTDVQPDRATSGR